MKFFGLEISLKRQVSKRIQVVTALSRIEQALLRIDAMEANVKETRQRLETIYRKVYRDIEKGDGHAEGPPPAPIIEHRIIKPGDSWE